MPLKSELSASQRTLGLSASTVQRGCVWEIPERPHRKEYMEAGKPYGLAMKSQGNANERGRGEEKRWQDCLYSRGVRLLYYPWIPEYVSLTWCSSWLQSCFKLKVSTCSLETLSACSPQMLFVCLTLSLGSRDTKTRESDKFKAFHFHVGGERKQQANWGNSFTCLEGRSCSLERYRN